MAFIEQIKKRVKGKNIRIALPESLEPRTLKAAEVLAKQKILRPVLIGGEEQIFQQIKKLKLGIKSQSIEVIDHKQSMKKDEYAKILYELRRGKGLGLAEAKKLLEDEMYFATMMLYHNDCDGVVSGAIHPTEHTLRPAFQIIKTKPGINVASGVFFMIKKEKGKEKIFLLADCAVNPDPNSEQLAQIAVTTAETCRQFGIKPKIAMLSFSTKGSAKHLLVDKVRIAANIALHELLSGAIIDGEIQLDAAINKEVAKQKCPASMLKGNANVLIFPDLNSGNIGYKLMEYFGGYNAIGPIIQGLNKPVNDLSRGATVKEIADVAMITALQSQKVI